MDATEYECALEKVARLRYAVKPKTASRLVSDINSKRTLSVSFLTGIRLKIATREVTEILFDYSSDIVKNFKLFLTSEQKKDPYPKLGVEECIDFFTVYFLCPEYLAIEEISSILVTVKQEFILSGQGHIGPEQIFFPQFLELLCRIAIQVHSKRVEVQRGNIRKSIENTKLDYCLEKLFQHMSFKMERVTSSTSTLISSLSSISNNAIEDQASKGTTFDQLANQLASLMDNDGINDNIKRLRLRPSTAPAYKKLPAPQREAILIKDVLELPNFDPDTLYTIECAFKYHNTQEFDMALATLSEVRTRLVQNRLDKMKIYGFKLLFLI